MARGVIQAFGMANCAVAPPTATHPAVALHLMEKMAFGAARCQQVLLDLNGAHCHPDASRHTADPGLQMSFSKIICVSAAIKSKVSCSSTGRRRGRACILLERERRSFVRGGQPLSA